MSGMKIYKGEFDKQLDLLFAPQIKAGFPSPAEDYMRESLDLTDNTKLLLPAAFLIVANSP